MSKQNNSGQDKKFSETIKTLLTFLICDTAVAVPLQPIVNCCAEVFTLVNYLYLVIVDDSIRLGWTVFPKINACLWFLLRSGTNAIYYTIQQSRLTQDHGQLHR